MKISICCFFLIAGFSQPFFLIAQNQIAVTRVYPMEITDVLTNPGIGFTTFQRFNGDTLNAVGWTEGLPDWLPGDIVYDETLYVPANIPTGKYRLEIALVSPVSFEPRVKLAINGINKDGWYPMGEIEIQEK